MDETTRLLNNARVASLLEGDEAAATTVATSRGPVLCKRMSTIAIDPTGTAFTLLRGRADPVTDTNGRWCDWGDLEIAAGLHSLQSNGRLEF